LQAQTWLKAGYRIPRNDKSTSNPMVTWRL